MKSFPRWSSPEGSGGCRAAGAWRLWPASAWCREGGAAAHSRSAWVSRQWSGFGVDICPCTLCADLCRSRGLPILLTVFPFFIVSPLYSLLCGRFSGAIMEVRASSSEQQEAGSVGSSLPLPVLSPAPLVISSPGARPSGWAVLPREASGKRGCKGGV